MTRLSGNVQRTNSTWGKDFHENVCEAAKKVTVTGKPQKVDGKKGIAATKIALAK